MRSATSWWPVLVEVKICGLVRRDDALRAVDAGADALGFVFAPASSRRADPRVVTRVVQELPADVVKVGVFMNQPLEAVRRLMLECGLDVAQLHGVEDPAFVRELGLPLLQAFASGGAALTTLTTLTALAPPASPWPTGEAAVLLDASQPGSGRPADWAQAAQIARTRRVVLAGGLSPDNVAEAIAAVRPWGVDASSGLESAPGCKDAGRMRAFVENAKAATGEGPPPAERAADIRERKSAWTTY